MRSWMLALALMAVCAPYAAAQQDSPDKDSGMKEWLEKAKPGENHKVLARMAGKWDIVSQMPGAAGQPGTQMKETMECRMVLGGRFLESESKGQFSGMPHETLALMGYDNITKKYILVSAENMSTFFIEAKGDYDAKTDTLRYEGEYNDPFSNGKVKMKFRWTWRFVGDDKMEFEMWEVPPPEIGQEYKAMTMTYTRQK